MESTTITPAALKKWAYRKSDSDIPAPLMELETVIEQGELLFTLVSDPQCPQRAKILNCLYFVVGQSVSTHGESVISSINTLLEKAAAYQDTLILNWVARAKIILRDLRKYDYAEWCDGGFVRKDLPVS